MSISITSNSQMTGGTDGVAAKIQAPGGAAIAAAFDVFAGAMRAPRLLDWVCNRPIFPPQWRTWVLTTPWWAMCEAAGFCVDPPERWFSDPFAESPAVSTGSRSVCRLVGPPDSDQAFVYKRYTFSPWLPMRRLRLSRAGREAQNYLAFQSLGIPGPELLVVGEERYGGILRSAVIVTRYIPGARCLTSLLADPEFRRDDALRTAVLEQLATLTGRAHAAGFYHWTLKPRNILVQFSPSPRVIWIDCPKGGFSTSGYRFSPRHGWTSLAVADLASILHGLRPAITAQELTAFLTRYRDVSGHTTPVERLVAAVSRCL